MFAHTWSNTVFHMYMLASFPGPRPASRRLQYGKQREAGRGPGNEAMYMQLYKQRSYDK